MNHCLILLYVRLSILFRNVHYSDMRKNLREMTNNKGYIWRGCWFFGELPSNPYENTVVFEKCRGVLRIHETDRRTHKIYEKIGSERKNLISTIPKKHKL